MDYVYKGGNIEFRNVGFKHLLTAPVIGKSKKQAELPPQPKKNDYLFRDLTLNIKAGTSNAIVGNSGFGKTTILNMINRIYDPTEGEVYLDGQKVKDLTFESFRKYIAVIP